MAKTELIKGALKIEQHFSKRVVRVLVVVQVTPALLSSDLLEHPGTRTLHFTEQSAFCHFFFFVILFSLRAPSCVGLFALEMKWSE